MKKGAKKPPASDRSLVRHVRFKDIRELDAIKKAAEKTGMSVSGFLHWSSLAASGYIKPRHEQLGKIIKQLEAHELVVPVT